MREQYMRSGDGFLLCFSITSRSSFQEIHTFHQQILRVKDRDWFPADLENQRAIGVAEARDAAKAFGCVYLETSAKTRVNVDEAFYNLVLAIRNESKAAGGGGGNSGNERSGGERTGRTKKRKFCIIM
ncbi:ras family-domain-containing protein [Chytridium lagenaria]|nr:ras family-domain-containing protein [Chytridium lagenaria]